LRRVVLRAPAQETGDRRHDAIPPPLRLHQSEKGCRFQKNKKSLAVGEFVKFRESLDQFLQ
jgi:hypothetical protein